MNKSLSALVLLASAFVVSSAPAATGTFTYIGGGPDTLWSDTANWSLSSGTATANYPSTATDTANLNDTGATSRVITYDAAASGTLGTLNITQTSAANNEVMFINSQASGTTTQSTLTVNFANWTISNNVTLGAAAGGTSEIFVNSYGDPTASTSTSGGRICTLKIGTTSTGTLTINGGGVLEMLSGAGGSVANDNLGAIVNANVTLAGGTINADRATFASTLGTSNATVSNFTMTSGTLNLGSANSLGLALNASPPLDERFYTGNFQATGGTINQLVGGTSNAVNTNANQSSLYIQGSTNFLAGTVVFNTTTFITLIGGANQTLYSNVPLNTIAARNASGSATYVKTLGAANADGSLNTAGTLTVGQLQFGDSSTTTTVLSNFALASNVTVKPGALSPARVYNAAVALAHQINVNNYTLDLTAVSTAAANNGGIYAPVNSNTASGGFANQAYDTQTLTGTTGGQIKALGFDLSQGGTTGGVNVAGSVTLQATGGAGTANNLSGSGATGITNLAATSTFLYSGGATSANPATLTATNRAIGMLQVTTGYLTINPASATALTTGGAVSVTNAGTLDIAGTTVGALTLNAGNFTVNGTTNGATLVLTLAGAGSQDTINATAGSGQSFSLTNMTIALNGAVNQTSYQVFNNFSGTNTVSGVTFTGVPSGETASIDTTGLITFATAAVPEPGTWVGGLIMMGAVFAGVRRSRAGRIAA